MTSWAITTDDSTLFSFLLDLTVEWKDRLASQHATESDRPSLIPTFSRSDFELAIEYGRIHLLEEMIKHGGAGIELWALVKKSGVKYKEKPKYYQGLSVSPYLPSMILVLLTMISTGSWQKACRLGICCTRKFQAASCSYFISATASCCIQRESEECGVVLE